MGAYPSQFEERPGRWSQPRRQGRARIRREGSTKSSQNTTKIVDKATKLGETQSMLPPKPSNQEPHMYKHILNLFDSSCSLENLPANGVLSSNKRKASSYHLRYWVENNINCFKLYARELSIIWSDDLKYWKWEPDKDESDIELAKLKMVCWLDVTGKFDIGMLSPGILYQVLFSVMLNDSAQGWELDVNFRLTLPGNKLIDRKENLKSKPKNTWIDILVGEFTTSDKDVGDMKISMYEHEGGMWKTGLSIRGVTIKPKEVGNGV
ncbi:unnamed protein product [Sphenostylis stenocarpa]|uniref:Uncharacterized protein n=1 Tax=Sphenostylis stenocarpa TaxID=92480 RepID=A0AA86SD29_9FABA|nr:unnamed protein product [Sphenostylis stenocarpa]